MIKGMQWYILKGHKITRVDSLEEWARWMESDSSERHIATDAFVNVEPWLSRDREAARTRSRNTTFTFSPAGPYSEDGATEIFISTIFLGLDHGWHEGSPPVLFETMVFNGPCDGDGQRYCTRADAEAGHARIVEEVKRHLLEEVK